MTSAIDTRCLSCGMLLAPGATQCRWCLPQIAAPDAVVPRAPCGGPRLAPRPVVSVPPGFSLGDDGRERSISWSTCSLGTQILFVFCLLWNGWWLVRFFLILGAGRFWRFPEGSSFVLQALVLVLSWGGLVAFFNRTSVRIHDGWLLVRHGPLPWFGRRTIAVADIAQLYVVDVFWRSNLDDHRSYFVKALLPGNRRITLLGPLATRDEALFVEQRLEAWLGIADWRIDGEIE